jgi:hypothetical protein
MCSRLLATYCKEMHEAQVRKTTTNQMVLQLTKTSCVNKNTCYLTLVKFITEDRMLRNTYLYENKMFTNKVKHSNI